MRNLDGIDALALAAVGLVAAFYTFVTIRLAVATCWGFCYEMRKALMGSDGKDEDAASGGAATTNVMRGLLSRTLRKGAVDLSAFLSFLVIFSAAADIAATWATIGVLLHVAYLATAPLREFLRAVKDGVMEGDETRGGARSQSAAAMDADQAAQRRQHGATVRANAGIAN